MPAFLLETSVLTISLDAGHPRYEDVVRALAALPQDSVSFISAVGLAELAFGAELAGRLGRGDVTRLREKVRSAHSYGVLDVTHHTATVYADTKAKLAEKYLASALRRDRPRYLEDWIDKATGNSLGIDENDLWMCAQAKEREITLVTADRRMRRIPEADPDVSMLVV